MTRTSFALLALLLIVRLPSLVQPMGADQGLYAYIGDRIRAADLPYRDAWDQKPPAVHYTYAALRAIWPHDGVVAAADLAVAAAIAALLYRLGGTLGGPAAGFTSAVLFLLLSNPAFTRLGGVRLRAQCETFIALAITGAFVLLVRRGAGTSAPGYLAAGVLFGVAITFKYNAAVYVVAGVLAMWVWRRTAAPGVLALGAGMSLPLAAMLAVFATGGALRAMYDATITYNLQYSGETYAGIVHFVRYLLVFPVQQARIDALWTLGGAGCVLLLLASVRSRERLVPVIWVAAACLSIAINGSRGLPQYFVQANPALALAAGCGAAVIWGWLLRLPAPVSRVAAAAVAIVVTVAVWRVNQFPKLVEQTIFDARYALGRVPAPDYLARYADDRKYSALAASELGHYLREHSAPDQSVYVFGFTGAAYVEANRTSASRFFWSRPVIVQFNAGRPGYGTAGLLSELSLAAPAVVALQQRDWAPDVDDSAVFFMATPPLADWLRAHYDRASGPEGFDVWQRRDRP